MKLRRISLLAAAAILLAATASARALFFGVNQNETDRYSDYKQFHVESSSTPFPPKQQ